MLSGSASEVSPTEKYSNGPWEWSPPHFTEDCTPPSPLKPPFICPHVWSSCRLQQTLANTKTRLLKHAKYTRHEKIKRTQGLHQRERSHTREAVSKPQPGILSPGSKTRSHAAGLGSSSGHMLGMGHFFYHFKTYQAFTSLLCKCKSTSGFLSGR